MVITPRKARTLALMAPIHVIGEPCLRWCQGTRTLKFQGYEVKKDSRKPQARILAYFIRGGTLTVWKAMNKFGTTELRKIVTRLRRKGYIIVGDWCYSHDADRGRIVRYKEYHMVVNPEIAQI